MEHGFNAMRVADVAEACGVSEATVFNYFQTKEALVLDRLETTMASLPAGLASPGIGPIEAALHMLAQELSIMMESMATQDDPRRAATAVLRFGDLIRATPSLRAYQSDMMEQFVSVVVGILAGRAGLSPDDPEPQIVARAILGLWHVQAVSLRKHLAATTPLDRIEREVAEDVRRAARLIGAGLDSLDILTPIPSEPEYQGPPTTIRH
jgi:AcrR family transcriptional regulator